MKPAAHGSPAAMPTKVGTRYVCTVCGSEFIVTKAGTGTLTCDGDPMAEKGAPSQSAPSPEGPQGLQDTDR